MWRHGCQILLSGLPYGCFLSQGCAHTQPLPPLAVIVEKHVENYGTQVLSNIVNGKLQSIPNSLIRASVWLPLRHIASKRNTYSPGERSDIFRCSRNQIFRFDGKLFFFGAISNHHVWLAELSMFGGFYQELTSNLLPEILTRDKHEERAEKRDLELSKSWEPTKKRVTWCLPQTSEVVICGLYPCEHVIPGPLRTHAKPDSAALGVQLCMYKGKPPGLKWQSLINLCRCRFAIRATNFRGTPLRNFTEASS